MLTGCKELSINRTYFLQTDRRKFMLTSAVEDIIASECDIDAAISASPTSDRLLDKNGRRLVLSSLLKSIPVLEQMLRVMFCTVNAHYSELDNMEVMSHHLLAQDGMYYTTLDGFGQKSKHQLLLDPHLAPSAIIDTMLESSSISQASDSAEPSTCNLLPQWLGPQIYALLVDLFLAADGPNLRSLLAHGDLMAFCFRLHRGRRFAKH